VYNLVCQSHFTQAKIALVTTSTSYLETTSSTPRSVSSQQEISFRLSLPIFLWARFFGWRVVE